VLVQQGTAGGQPTSEAKPVSNHAFGVRPEMQTPGKIFLLLCQKI